ncbi:interleukin-13 receptor subunit alpha-1-like [Polypterus senegalus]|uniref:interleukin-13 receptor subunit alpha-1-like n=1 Tax=Polypterus senegalus TaxID=55291 RepID=UPI001965C959|nr:interleukin-13 receptor subunit alpha-1-like [Polypterus senegalus]
MPFTSYFALFCSVAASLHAYSHAVPPPLNLTFSLRNLFTAKWSWSPPAGLNNCLIEYISEVNKNSPEWTVQLFREGDLDLNNGTEFRVKASNTCQNHMAAEWATIFIPPPSGDFKSSVMNFECLMYMMGYMNCTWMPGIYSDYNLYYWYRYLEKVQSCKQYIYIGGIRQGCHFQPHDLMWKNIKDTIIYIFVNGSKENSTKPFFYKNNLLNIVKPTPPNIFSVTVVKDSVQIKWEEPPGFNKECLLYQINYKSIRASTWMPISTRENSATVPIDPHLQYAFKVRSKYDTCGDGSWSEWSNVKESEHIYQMDRIIYIAPVVAVIFALITLFYIKRLRMLLLPPVPDPSKFLKGMIGKNGELLKLNKQHTDNTIFFPDYEEEFSTAQVEHNSNCTSDNRNLKVLDKTQM